MVSAWPLPAFGFHSRFFQCWSVLGPVKLGVRRPLALHQVWDVNYVQISHARLRSVQSDASITTTQACQGPAVQRPDSLIIWAHRLIDAYPKKGTVSQPGPGPKRRRTAMEGLRAWANEWPAKEPIPSTLDLDVCQES